MNKTEGTRTFTDSTVLLNLLAGGFSGGIARFFVAPLDVVKIRFQMQTDPQAISRVKEYARPKYYYSGILNAFSTIYKQEGIQGLWRGNLVAEYLWVLSASLQFGSFALYKNAANKVLGVEELPPFGSLLCGAAAGATSTALTYPLDLLRTRFAAQGLPPVYTSIGHAVRSIYQTTGMKGFYYGICPSLWQFIPYVGVQFFVYDSLQKQIKKHQIDIGTIGHTASGACAGMAAKLVSFPLDVAKKRLQIHGMNLFKSGIIPDRCPSLAITMKNMYDGEGNNLTSLFGFYYPSSSLAFSS
eukprot:TRINITY_DN4649_c0_g1_i2.p1 TRINITY_DN4649_c0_g1~~TRINITY_DN4649_c0_g1_i2.p1  ORF type:complete len:299 (+),score=35.09 TRINITY_DN4649_c0_g1_i2:86-982(+)